MASVQELIQASQAKHIRPKSKIAELSDIINGGLDTYADTKSQYIDISRKMVENQMLEEKRKQIEVDKARYAKAEEDATRKAVKGLGMAVGVTPVEKLESALKESEEITLGNNGEFSRSYKTVTGDPKAVGNLPNTIEAIMARKVQTGEMTLEQALAEKRKNETKIEMTPYQKHQIDQDAKKITDNQQTSALFGTRAQQAQAQMLKIVSEGQYDPSSMGAAGSRLLGKTDLTNTFRSEAGQQYDQAADNLIGAILRKESGATITAEERAQGYRDYIVRPGDKPGVIAQKNLARETAIAGLLAGAKNGQGVAGAGGVKVKVSNGQETMMIDAADEAEAAQDGFQRVP